MLLHPLHWYSFILSLSLSYGTISASRLKVMFWNCRGYPWNKGLGLNDIAQGMDIIFLVGA